MKSFGVFLKFARKQRNLTQEQVAESLNIVTPVLSKWENDKAIPSLDLLCKLCNVLNISIEECINSELSDGERQLPPEQYDSGKLGETIKDLRIKNGWSQAEVGKKLFVTSQTVSKWESGGISSLEILDKLAELFGVTPTQLFNELECKPAMPEKQVAAEQIKKPKRFVLKVTTIVLAVLIMLGAVAGLIVGLVLHSRNDDKQTPTDITDVEKPAEEEPTPPVDEPTTGEPEQPLKPADEEESAFGLPMQSKIFRTHLERYFDTYGDYDDHDGVDFTSDFGDKVYAVADGVIKKTYMRQSDGYAYITIDHGDGIIGIYRGVKAIEGLAEGGEVKKSQLIGTVSESSVGAEIADGPHLHFSMTVNGESVDPLGYIPYEEK